MKIFSLQRRFLILLLLPVTLILIAVGVASFMYARGFLVEQWVIATQLKLDKAAHQIGMALDEKLSLITLIGKASGVPNGYITRTFLIQQLLEKKGVRFVDIETPEGEKDTFDQSGDSQGTSAGDVEGLYTMELCGDLGVLCDPTTDPNAPDRALRIVKYIEGGESTTPERLVVRISFDSFLQPIKKMNPWEGSTVTLITGAGQFLSVSDKSFMGRKKLGDNGNELEIKVLEEIRTKPFGTVRGSGHPPDAVAVFYQVPGINWYILLFSKGAVIMEPIVQFRFYYALAGIIALATIVLLIRLATRSVGKSISEISAAAARVRNGDYNIRIPSRRSDEVGQLCASFNAMIDGLRERDLIEQTFGRYVDKKVAEELMSRPEALRLGGEKRTVTIMMSDLRNFTSIAEKLDPEEVIALLNRYFSRMLAVIERYRGIVVDFYGDSILVFFNGVETDVQQRAADAVNCALEMQRELQMFVKETASEDWPELTMGVGIHTGEVIVGNIGTETRAKYGIVGSNVNLTDRIQYTATGGKVVVSEQTYEVLNKKLSVASEVRVCLKGVEEDRIVYEIEAVEREWERAEA